MNSTNAITTESSPNNLGSPAGTTDESFMVFPKQESADLVSRVSDLTVQALLSSFIFYNSCLFELLQLHSHPSILANLTSYDRFMHIYSRSEYEAVNFIVRCTGHAAFIVELFRENEFIEFERF